MDMKQNELIFILESNKSKEVSEETLCSSAIVINLYYEETLNFYMEYINEIPQKVDVYIISSKEVIFQRINQDGKIRENLHLIRKKNRGRDISALLVSVKSIVNQYHYICFVHDKKEKTEYLKNDVLDWNLNLWDNSIGTEGYIQNILLKFEQKPSLGMMVPPKPDGKYMESYGELFWGKDYEKTVELAKKMGLECTIERSIPPLTIGTVFWARTEALKKLFEIEWEYESFPDEPMADDGEINHAIERVLGYVVQDAGFDVAITMINTYAEKQFIKEKEAHDYMREILRKELGIRCIHEAEKYYQQKNQITEFFKKNEKVYLYGIGEFGKILLDRIRYWGYEPYGLVVSDGYKMMNSYMGYEICELSELKSQKDDIGIIITVNFDKQAEMIDNLSKSGINNYILGYL